MAPAPDAPPSETAHDGGLPQEDGLPRALTGDAHRLGQRLLQAGRLVAVAESCTGGLIAAALTETAGSSAWFERGFVTYSNAAKRQLLGVRAGTLAAHGAVSEATAREMASGALANSAAQVALSVTGIAGPGGAVPGKPVGTVCFGWALADGTTQAETVRFDGSRAAVRLQAARHAVQRALALLDDTAGKV